MTDERAKEIAEEMRQSLSDDPSVSINPEAEQTRTAFVLKLYDDLQAIKQAMQGLSFLGVGGGIKPVTKVEG